MAGGHPFRTRAGGHRPRLGSVSRIVKDRKGAGHPSLCQALTASAGGDCHRHPWPKGSAAPDQASLQGKRCRRLAAQPNLDKRTRVRGRAVLQDFPVCGAWLRHTGPACGPRLLADTAPRSFSLAQMAVATVALTSSAAASSATVSARGTDCGGGYTAPVKEYIPGHWRVGRKTRIPPEMLH